MKVKFLGAVLGIAMGLVVGSIFPHPAAVACGSMFVYEVVLVAGEQSGF